MDFFPTNFIQIFQITSTIKVNGIVAAQNIQKFDDTLTEPVPELEEKSTIDMLNREYDLSQKGISMILQKKTGRGTYDHEHSRKEDRS